jgi:hypothetical protein
MAIPGGKGATTTQSGSDSLLQQLLAQIAPEQQLGEMGVSSEEGLLQLAPQLFGLQQGYLGAQYANQLGQYGIQGQQLGLQGQGLGLQQKYLGQQEQTAAQQYGLQTGAGGTFSLENLQNQLQAAQQNLATTGNTAASGAIGSRGYGIQMGENALQNYLNTQGLKNTEQEAKLGYQAQQQGFGYQQGQLGLSQAGLGLQQSGLGLEEQMAGAQYGYQSTQNRVQGAETQMSDYSQLLQQLAQLSGNVTGAGAGLGILQGLSLPNGGSTQPNSGN